MITANDQQTYHQELRSASLPDDVARCDGVGFAEDDGWDWRKGCDVCLRRTAARPAQVRMMEPPAIIAFECEYLILPTGRHPFMRQSDEYGQRIILKMNRPQTLPQFTGQILVRMLPVFEHCGPWEIVRVEEGFMEYMDGEPADPEEWECWADLSTFSFNSNNHPPQRQPA